MNQCARLFVPFVFAIALASGACDLPPEADHADPARTSQAQRLSADTTLTVAAGRASQFTLAYTDPAGRKQCLKNPTIRDLQSLPGTGGPATNGSDAIDPVCALKDLGCVIILTANCPIDQGIECSFDTCGCAPAC